MTEIIIDRYQPLMILNDVCATEAPPVVTSQRQDWAQTINEAWHSAPPQAGGSRRSAECEAW